MTLLRAYLTIASSFLHVRTVGVDESIDVLETLSPSPSVLVSRRLAIPPVPGDRPGTMLIEAVSVTERTLVATVAKKYFDVFRHRNSVAKSLCHAMCATTSNGSRLRRTPVPGQCGLCPCATDVERTGT